jgi:multidrug efflux pump subunit AcrA (membrane-fusion protein)
VGLFVEAEIQGRRVERAVVLPRAALRRQEASPGAAAADGHFVLVVDHESRLEFRSVEVLRTEREQVVIGEGLQAGERVCVSPLRAAVEGMTVRVAGDDAGRLATTRPAGEDAAEARP